MKDLRTLYKSKTVILGTLVMILNTSLFFNFYNEVCEFNLNFVKISNSINNDASFNTTDDLNREVYNSGFINTTVQGKISKQLDFNRKTESLIDGSIRFVPRAMDFDLSLWDSVGYRTGGYTSSDPNERYEIPYSYYTGSLADPEIISVVPAGISGTWNVRVFAYLGSGSYLIEIYSNGIFWDSYTGSLNEGEESPLYSFYVYYGEELDVVLNYDPISDITPPSVSITSPNDGATVSDTISISATASDNVEVTKVEFYIDNILERTDTSSPYNYNWDTQSVSDSSHEIKVIAYDAAGNTDTDIHLVNVDNSGGDITSPEVSITSPLSGAILNGTIMISATASDNVEVTKVEFYIDDILHSTDTSSPYNYNWNTISVSNGSHEIKVIAYDAAGNEGVDACVVNIGHDDSSITVIDSHNYLFIAILLIAIGAFVTTGVIGSIKHASRKNYKNKFKQYRGIPNRQQRYQAPRYHGRPRY